MKYINMKTSDISINNLLKEMGNLTEDDLSGFGMSCLMLARVDSSLPDFGDFSPVLA